MSTDILSINDAKNDNASDKDLNSTPEILDNAENTELSETHGNVSESSNCDNIAKHGSATSSTPQNGTLHTPSAVNSDENDKNSESNSLDITGDSPKMEVVSDSSMSSAQVSTPEDSSLGDSRSPELEDEALTSDPECTASPTIVPEITNVTNQKDIESSHDDDEVLKEKRLSDINIPAPEDSGSSSRSATCSSQPQQNVYHIKWVRFHGQKVAIITQNENGPCPLLAIVNVLLLRGKIKMLPSIEVISAEKLMKYLTDYIFDNPPENFPEDTRLNYEQNMNDAMAVFHKLQTGLDVNVKFTGVQDFEYTRECIVFDLLSIPLYHGWLVDPECPEICAAVSNCSYNQLVEKIITQNNSQKEELQTEALIAEEFLLRTASQLTYHGLAELSTTVKEGELCVIFRNNHFSTLYRHKNELFVLMTDQGFLTECNAVWETLSNVEGDGHFVDGDFKTFRKDEPITVPRASPESQPTIVPGLDPAVPGTSQQIDQDYLVALTLQQEQQGDTSSPAAETTDVGGGGVVGGTGGTGGGSGTHESDVPESVLAANEQEIQDATKDDHNLALRLQEEEDAYIASMQQQQEAGGGGAESRPQRPVAPGTAREQQPTGGNGKKDGAKSDCVIL